MSDDDEALRLNTLNRFRKHSPRLLLEEYSHCEVPAGCGGVVMRWVDPQASIPVLLRMFTPGDSTAYIDGVEVETSRVDLTPGEPHVLALEYEGGPLLVTMLRALGRDVDWGEDAEVLVTSRAGADWRITDTSPPEHWKLLDFDDSAWPLGADGSEALAPFESGNEWRIRQQRDQGADPIVFAPPGASQPSGGLLRRLVKGPPPPPPPKRCWARVTFEIPQLDREEIQG